MDLAGAAGKFSVKWFNPREGGAPAAKGSAILAGGSKGTLTAPSAEDWLAVVAKEASQRVSKRNLRDISKPSQRF